MNNSANDMQEKSSYSIWELYEEKNIEIPSIQRGLVWKPAQVSLLWDSIFRGIPIGSFILTSYISELSKETKEDSDKKYFLLDGQQRFNSIKLGLNSDPSDISLWLDLLYEQGENKKEKKYMIYVCTKAHPWGFNENGGKIGHSKLKDAFSLYNCDNTRPKLNQSWPIDAKLPIPLYVILTALKNANSEELFYEELEKEFKKIPQMNNEVFKKTISESKSEITRLYEGLKKLKYYYKIPIIRYSPDGDDEKIELTELIFDRLNNGGTQVSNDDMIYSAIMAFWPDLYQPNWNLAKDRLRAVQLIQFSFRLCLTKIEIESHGESNSSSKEIKFSAMPSVFWIRKWAKSDEKDVKGIRGFYSKRLEEILNRIYEWIYLQKDSSDDDKRLLPVLVSSILNRKPDIYLLLMCLADRSLNESEDEFLKDWCSSSKGDFFSSLALIIYIFSVKGKYKNITNRIIEYLTNEDCSLKGNATKASIILAAVQDSIIAGDMRLIPPIESIKEEIEKLKNKEFFKEWGWWSICNTSEAGEFLSTYRNEIEILLHSTRAYVRNFDYDPAMTELWSGHNRPWDIDHIVPNDWSHNKKNRNYKWACDRWINTIANKQPLDFSSNRSKKAGSILPSVLLEEKTLGNLFLKEFVNEQDLEFKANIIDEKNEAEKFNDACASRYESILKKLYKDLFIDEFLFNEIRNFSYSERREFFDEIFNFIRGLFNCEPCYYTYKNNRDNKLSNKSKSFGYTSNIVLGVLGEIGNKNEPLQCLFCICLNGLGDNSRVQVGVRKHPFVDSLENRFEGNDGSYNYNTDYWDTGHWYVEVKDYVLGFSVEKVKDSLEKLKNDFPFDPEKKFGEGH